MRLQTLAKFPFRVARGLLRQAGIHVTPATSAATAAPEPVQQAPVVPARSFQVEQTPNPDARKFICDTPLLESGSRMVHAEADARGLPGVGELVASDLVRSVFVLGDFMTVTRAPGADWDELQAFVLKTMGAA